MTREEAIKHLSEWMDEKMWRCFGTIDREDQNRRLHDMYQYGKAYGYTEAKDEIGEIDLDDLDPSVFEEVES